MPDIHRFTERAFDSSRYGDGPDWRGIDLWGMALAAVLEAQPPALDWSDPENPVHGFREAAEAAGAALGGGPPPRPIVFVSHSHKDAAEAEALANEIATSTAYDVWLDIWDPELTFINQSSLPEQRKALLIALSVEMGLLNSTHLVALYTKNSEGSAWVPYEYGRVKPKSVFSVNASALLPRSNLPSYEPEYLGLGKKFETIPQVIQWLLP